MNDYLSSKTSGSSDWERLVGESSRQFASFQIYRDSHPLDRSLAQVANKLGCSSSYVERLSGRFRWVARTAAFDREQDRLSQARRVRRIEEMNDRHAQLTAVALRKVGEALQAIDPRSLKPTEMARLLDVATKAERMALGVLHDEPQVHGISATPFNANEVRRLLKQEGLLGEALTPDRPDSVTEEVERWLDGDQQING